jgi:cation-transporting ATPase E
MLLLALCFELLLVLAALIDRGPVVESVRSAIVIMGLVPNGLFLATATAYAMGAVRLAGRGALVQQANAVEALSHVDVLCLDKTGTLTTGRLALGAIHPVGIAEAELRRLLGDYAGSTAAGNRTTEGLAASLPGRARPVRAEAPFSPERRWSGLAFGDAEGGAYVLGAPETLGPRLEGGADLGRRVEAWTGRGLRVLLLARWPEGQPFSRPSASPSSPTASCRSGWSGSRRSCGPTPGRRSRASPGPGCG